MVCRACTVLGIARNIWDSIRIQQSAALGTEFNLMRFLLRMPRARAPALRAALVTDIRTYYCAYSYWVIALLLAILPYYLVVCSTICPTIG